MQTRRPGRGRPTKDGAQRTIPTQVMLTAEQKAWLQEAGGSPGLRRLINEAMAKPVSCVPAGTP